MRGAVKKVLDKTTIDDRLAARAREVADKTTVDDKLLQASRKLNKEIRSNTGKAILAAFGFMIALVWRDVVQGGVQKLIDYLSLSGDGFAFQVITAVITTVICVLGIIYFSRWSEK